jgi:hypothetical protein
VSETPAIRESDQLPEEQPAPAAPGTPSTPEKRSKDVGLDPKPRPDSRRNTGNEHD